MAGWYRSECSHWPEIAEVLPKPWPRAAALNDLRWYGDRKNHAGERIPGRRNFAKRWGWPDRKARTLIASFEWWDVQWGDEASISWGPASEGLPTPESSLPRGRPASVPPPSRSRPASVPVGEGQTPAMTPKTSRLRPGRVPPVSRSRPADVHTRVGDTYTSPSPSPAPEEAEASPPTTALHLPGMGGLVQDDPAPTGPPAPIAAAGKKKSFGPSDKRKAAQRIYDAYRVHHPDEPEVPSKGDGRKITARLTELAQQFKGKRSRYQPEDWATAEQDLLDLVEWIHTAPDASFWQGDNDRNREYLGITPIFKSDKFSDRLKSTRAWRKAGRSQSARRPGGGVYSGKHGDVAPPPPPPPEKPPLSKEDDAELRRLKDMFHRRVVPFERNAEIKARRDELEAKGRLRNLFDERDEAQALEAQGARR